MLSNESACPAAEQDAAFPPSEAPPAPEWPHPFRPEVIRPGFGRISSYAIALEAWRRGLQVTALSSGLYTYRITDSNGRAVVFNGSRPSMTSKRATTIARDKHAANRYLRDAGLPVAMAERVTAGEGPARLKAIAEKLTYPLVIKPATGSQGRGVFTNIETFTELRDYYHHLTSVLGVRNVVLETQLSGETEIRVLVINGRIAGAVHRVPANVVGDGRATVSELIEQKNIERSRNPFLSSGPIVVDREVEEHLQAADVALDRVLPAGHRLQLRSISNASAGGDSIDVTDTLPEEIGLDCVRAVASIPDMFCAGVDVLVDTRSGACTRHSIVEINATPQIGLNMYPSHGKGRDVPKMWLDECFPDSARSGHLAEESLTFSYRQLVAPLRAGVASEVTLAAIPPSRLPCRHIYNFPARARLTTAERRRLEKRALDLGIAGRIKQEQTSFKLTIAADDHDDCRAFETVVRTIFDDREPESVKPWTGIVRHGFTVLS